MLCSVDRYDLSAFFFRKKKRSEVTHRCMTGNVVFLCSITGTNKRREENALGFFFFCTRINQDEYDHSITVSVQIQPSSPMRIVFRINRLKPFEMDSFGVKAFFIEDREKKFRLSECCFRPFSNDMPLLIITFNWTNLFLPFG